MRWDFFHRRESNRVAVDAKPLVPYQFELEGVVDLWTALEDAKDSGLPEGSARGGCVEIHNDLGIYTTRSGRKFSEDRPEDVIFKTWQQLEAEDNGCFEKSPAIT